MRGEKFRGHLFIAIIESMTRAIAILVLLVAGPALRADETSKLAAVDKLIRLTKGEEMLRAQMEQIRALVTLRAKQSASAERAGEVAKRMVDLMEERMSWPRLRAGMVKIYVDLFSEEELNGIIAFYESPAGDAFLKKMPQLMQKSMQMGSEVMGNLDVEMKRILEESLEKEKSPEKPKKQ